MRLRDTGREDTSEVSSPPVRVSGHRPIGRRPWNVDRPTLIMVNMAKARNSADSTSRGDRQFAATRWSIVIAAGHQSSPDSRRALESRCQTYWYPLYAYVRRQVANVHEAQDLTQEFFATLLERNSLEAVHRERGRFRSFLLTAGRNFLADEWDKAKARKRGGGLRAIPLNLESGESRYVLELHACSP